MTQLSERPGSTVAQYNVVERTLDSWRDRLVAASHDLHDHPEVGGRLFGGRVVGGGRVGAGVAGGPYVVERRRGREPRQDRTCPGHQSAIRS